MEQQVIVVVQGYKELSQGGLNEREMNDRESDWFIWQGQNLPQWFEVSVVSKTHVRRNV